MQLNITLFNFAFKGENGEVNCASLQPINPFEQTLIDGREQPSHLALKLS